MDALHDTAPSAVFPLEPGPSSVPARPSLDALYYPAGKLAGKVALITGGTSSIGQAVAQIFAREGADIALVHSSDEADAGAATRDFVEAVGQRCQCFKADLREPAECQRAVERTVQELGRLDILVNNATAIPSGTGIEDLSIEQWEETLRTNLDNYFYMVKAALRYLNDGSSIINTGSTCILRKQSGVLDYAASKGGIHAFTTALASDLARRRNIRVNCVAPGPIVAPGAEEDPLPQAGRSARPEEVAPAYVYFASADSRYVSGAILSLPGGESGAP